MVLIRAAFKETTRDSLKEKKRVGRRIEQHQRTPARVTVGEELREERNRVSMSVREMVGRW